MNKLLRKENGFVRVIVVLLVIMSFSLGITLSSLKYSQERIACREWAEEEIKKAEQVSMLD